MTGFSTQQIASAERQSGMIDRIALYDPSKHLSTSEFNKLGYPKPIVDHFEAKDRALRRYKTPGET
jgi:deoxyribodipyrimidine photolyase